MGSRQNSPLTVAETGSFLWPSVKLTMNQLPLEIIRTARNDVCQHTVSIIDKIWYFK